MPFICDKCHHSFDSQTKLQKHLKRRIPCVPDDNIMIHYLVNIVIKNTQANTILNRHMYNCRVKNNPELLIKQIEKWKTFMNKIIRAKR